MYRHKKKCSDVSMIETPTAPLQDDIQIQTNIILELIKQNQEFKQLIVDQNKQLYEKHEENIDLQKQLLDVVKDGKSIRMFLRGLNSLDVTKRPIHCSDVKREIMHIKENNKWEKDNAAQDMLKNIIKQLTHKNIMMLDDWKQANTGCTEYNSRKYDHYLKLTMESMGPTDEVAEKRDFNKIIRRVAENTAIDKKYIM